MVVYTTELTDLPLTHQRGGNPEQAAIDEHGSIIQFAFYSKLIKQFFSTEVLKVMRSIKLILDMFKDVSHEIWLLGFN